ncbi:uncharacterized protein LOC123445487 [Hordeum vulgare subsp. vulgare]|uniref:uncharacterized protein LOC123444835 n=1 Tax=Hordeum vulgare subsp. vulgare TaxID=112509 RepID=UPI001D1A40CC|nr:uncharacterized protein LOC123444835 [Hordeum vulgare subsp. vulgare]XP_044977782.1 uncharacterized protein LOC123444923 [Hordeum vulgare subsp. vulgare]XP_044978017.1 uncharacterized protein LOC123445109 [Hordeum vulgare subsp. vulgare]XP_044978444.1 uncharacterized protein LOC123445487 [Hordeum vulgare subsp. vulgare]
MRLPSPSLLLQCLTGLLSHEKAAAHCIDIVPGRDQSCLSSPAAEMVPSQDVQPYKYAGNNIEMHGMNIFKGKFSVVDIVGLSRSDLAATKGQGKSNSPTSYIIVLTSITWKGEDLDLSFALGPLKCCQSSLELVNILKNEICDGLLAFRSKRVLELYIYLMQLSCGYGLPGIFSCLKVSAFSAGSR